MNLKEEVLDFQNEKHIRSVGDFSCGADHPLNDFLCSFANEYAKNKYGLTYLLFLDDEIAAFYTLKVGSIIMNDGETVSIPLAEIARIAVSFDLQNYGLGTSVFYDFIMPKVEIISKYVAIFGIMVFVLPDDKNAISFYEHIGFVRADDEVQRNIDHFNEDCDLYILKL